MRTSIELNSIKLTEISSIDGSNEPKVDGYFLQHGVVGFYASENELKNLYDLLTYYYTLNISEQVKMVAIDNE
jgi:hypothetical protein